MTETPGRVVTVLIGDDEPLIREVLREVLQAEPDLDVVAVARDAEEAIELAGRHAPAIAILDVRMPAGGGAHAARGIRRRSPGTRIMAFSAYGDAGSVDQMRLAGVTEYLLKGLPNADIVAAVRRMATDD
ncbi:transcriptional regulator [Microtetraspora sp. NBRC 13810]|uniref:response regulator n=1 Tax=Microtetraspora sp. NBRC 13810 TaxID=3030990 RepID=UPI0024A249E1|nr:response regulator transcription factor [Microtetraspora sp. NBRC 13810]GLW07173.1 transcriptional regulator [Microtetraspora sp. NBRC 13810]